MYRQLQKLAILCNTCFWGTVVFQIWERARLIPEPVLNSIVILGISALLVNIITGVIAVFYYRKSPEHQKMKAGIKWFMILSAVCQLFWLTYNIQAQYA